MPRKRMLPDSKEKRLAIVRDALQQLDHPTIPLRLTYSSYVTGPWPDELPETGDLKPYVDLIQKSCKVCGLGALLISKVRLYDRFPIEDLNDRKDIDRVAVSWDRLKKQFLGIFTIHQFNLIEVAFERSLCGDPVRGYQKAITFGKMWGDPRERFRGILQNILANDGVFKP